MQVKDIMEPVAGNWLRPEQTLHDAICTMRGTRWLNLSVNGMVVLENGIKLVGIVSIKDVVKAIIPPYLIDTPGGFSWKGMLQVRAAKARDMLVRDIMSTELVTVGPDDFIIECADLLINRGLQRLPVLDDAGRVIGLVHIRDVYLAVTDYICGKEVG